MALLNERATAALELGEIKDRMPTAVHDPDRESQVLDHVASLTNGPLDDEAIRRVFTRIIEENRRLEYQNSDNSPSTGDDAGRE